MTGTDDGAMGRQSPVQVQQPLKSPFLVVPDTAALDTYTEDELLSIIGLFTRAGMVLRDLRNLLTVLYMAAFTELEANALVKTLAEARDVLRRLGMDEGPEHEGIDLLLHICSQLKASNTLEDFDAWMATPEMQAVYPPKAFFDRLGLLLKDPILKVVRELQDRIAANRAAVAEEERRRAAEAAAAIAAEEARIEAERARAVAEEAARVAAEEARVAETARVAAAEEARIKATAAAASRDASGLKARPSQGVQREGPSGEAGEGEDDDDEGDDMGGSDQAGGGKGKKKKKKKPKKKPPKRALGPDDWPAEFDDLQLDALTLVQNSPPDLRPGESIGDEHPPPDLTEAREAMSAAIFLAQDPVLGRFPLLMRDVAACASNAIGSLRRAGQPLEAFDDGARAGALCHRFLEECMDDPDIGQGLSGIYQELRALLDFHGLTADSPALLQVVRGSIKLVHAFLLKPTKYGIDMHSLDDSSNVFFDLHDALSSLDTLVDDREEIFAADTKSMRIINGDIEDTAIQGHQRFRVLASCCLRISRYYTGKKSPDAVGYAVSAAVAQTRGLQAIEEIVEQRRHDFEAEREAKVMPAILAQLQRATGADLKRLEPLVKMRQARVKAAAVAGREPTEEEKTQLAEALKELEDLKALRKEYKVNGPDIQIPR